MSYASVGRAADTRPLAAVVPCRTPVTGGVKADLKIIDGLRDRGQSVKEYYFSRNPKVPQSYRWWRQITFNFRLLWQLRKLPNGSIVLEDQALSTAVTLCNAYLRRFREVRIVLITYHLTFPLWKHPIRRWVHRWVEGREARRADLVLVSSKHTEQQLRALGVEESRMRRISLGIRTPARSRIPGTRASGGPVRLLSVGTVEPRKGLHDLVSALALIEDESWEMAIAGSWDTSYHRQLVEQIQGEGLSERVKFLGRVEDDELDELMARADVFVHASLQEGFGLAVGEAMAWGLPVVATYGSALQELIEDGHTGLLVSPAAPEELAQAITRLIADPELARALGDAAAQKIAGRYTWEKCSERVDAILREL